MAELKNWPSLNQKLNRKLCGRGQSFIQSFVFWQFWNLPGIGHRCQHIVSTLPRPALQAVLIVWMGKKCRAPIVGLPVSTLALTAWQHLMTTILL